MKLELRHVEGSVFVGEGDSLVTAYKSVDVKACPIDSLVEDEAVDFKECLQSLVNTGRYERRCLSTPEGNYDLVITEGAVEFYDEVYNLICGLEILEDYDCTLSLSEGDFMMQRDHEAPDISPQHEEALIKSRWSQSDQSWVYYHI